MALAAALFYAERWLLHRARIRFMGEVMSLGLAKTGIRATEDRIRATPERILAWEEGSRRREMDVSPWDGEIRVCRPRHSLHDRPGFLRVTTHFSPRHANFLAGQSHYV